MKGFNFNIPIGGKKKLLWRSIRSYTGTEYEYTITWADKLKMLFSDTIKLEVEPTTLISKVAHATSVHFNLAVKLRPDSKDEDKYFYVRDKQVEVVGSLYFHNLGASNHLGLLTNIPLIYSL